MKELGHQIIDTYNVALKEGQKIEVDEYLPCIVVYRGEHNEYSYQGEEAQDLIDEYTKWWEAQDIAVSLEQYILWLAQGW